MYTREDRKRLCELARAAWDAVAWLHGYHSKHHCGCRHCETMHRVLAGMEAQLEALATDAEVSRKLGDGDPWSQIEAN